MVGLHRHSNLLAEFCDNFKLTVNELKYKILVFKNVGVLSSEKSGSIKESA